LLRYQRSAKLSAELDPSMLEIGKDISQSSN